MATYLTVMVRDSLKLLAVAAGAIYAGMVLMWYRTDGPHAHPSFELRDPVRSLQTLVVWLGVRVLDTCLRLGKTVFNTLLEASAEVGEWFMRRSPAVKQTIRSRFLV